MKSVYFFAIVWTFSGWLVGSEDRPNVLVIMVDDLRPELGCYGVDYVQSPNIDRLAARGVVFERAYCQQAHCASSRFSMLSGCRPDTAGIWTNDDVREALQDKVFYPAHFRENGYYTVGLGKIAHNNWEDPRCWTEPHQMPKNYPYEYRTRAGQALVKKMQSEAAEAGEPDPFEGIAENVRRGLPYESLDVTDSALGDGQLADEAIKALQRTGDRPFLLGVGFLRPHLPFVAPKRYWDLYDPEKLPKVDPHATHDGLASLSANDSRELRTQYRGVPASGPLSEELARNLWHGYLACVSYVDAQVGRILNELEQLGLAEKTVVVLASDHGFHLGEIGLWCKASNFDAATRSVLIVADPRKKVHGATTGAVVELIGLYPTLCDLVGLPKPRHLQGKSFVEVLDNPMARPVEAAFGQYPRGESMGRSVRTERYRLVEWRHQTTHEIVGHELYDHSFDPDETKNLAKHPEHAEVVRALTQMLQQLPSKY